MKYLKKFNETISQEEAWEILKSHEGDIRDSAADITDTFSSKIEFHKDNYWIIKIPINNYVQHSSGWGNGPDEILITDDVLELLPLIVEFTKRVKHQLDLGVEVDMTFAEREVTLAVIKNINYEDNNDGVEDITYEDDDDNYFDVIMGQE